MTATHELADGLFDILNSLDLLDDTELADIVDAPTPLRGASVETFYEAGLLTTDAGLVICLPDGSEFQVTIVRSA
jgi:hypothetical protein